MFFWTGNRKWVFFIFCCPHFKIKLERLEDWMKCIKKSLHVYYIQVNSEMRPELGQKSQTVPLMPLSSLKADLARNTEVPSEIITRMFLWLFM